MRRARPWVVGNEVDLGPDAMEERGEPLRVLGPVVLTREDLLAAVWGYDIASGVRTVDSHVRAVRRKLGADLIRTVHGVGYAMETTT